MENSSSRKELITRIKYPITVEVKQPVKWEVGDIFTMRKLAEYDHKTNTEETNPIIIIKAYAHNSREWLFGILTLHPDGAVTCAQSHCHLTHKQITNLLTDYQCHKIGTMKFVADMKFKPEQLPPIEV